MYGRILKFLRISCSTTYEVSEIAVVEWFAPPAYPDGDPLLVSIDLNDEPPVNENEFLFLEEIDPTKVMYELCDRGDTMFVMRMHGLDTMM